jgi:hypothetical protein
MKGLLAVFAVVLAGCIAGPAQAAGAGGMFGRGSVQVGVLAGGGTAFNNSYTILGAGVNYYVIDGLSLGLAYEHWSGTGPSISKTTPSVQYVFYQLDPVKPYIGAFYRRVTVSGQPDYNSVGGRAGVYIAAARHVAIGVGYAEEKALSCQRSIYSSCTSGYAEISALVAF